MERQLRLKELQDAQVKKAKEDQLQRARDAQIHAKEVSGRADVVIALWTFSQTIFIIIIIISLSIVPSSVSILARSCFACKH